MLHSFSARTCPFAYSMGSIIEYGTQVRSYQYFVLVNRDVFVSVGNFSSLPATTNLHSFSLNNILSSGFSPKRRSGRTEKKSGRTDHVIVAKNTAKYFP